MAGENGTVTPSLKISLVNAYHPALHVSNIRSLVPLVLDGETVQFTPWATLFRNTAKVYAVLDHIDSTVSRPSDVEDGLWERLDAVVLQWIYGTVYTDLLYRILDEKATAMVVWEKLRDLFQDNKGTRVVHLENQFGMIKLENCSSLADYCQRLKSISDQLSAMGHSISKERLVLQLAGKLMSDYAMVATLIQQASPLPSFSKACSMLELDRVSREKNQEDSSLTSSSTALVAKTTSSGGSSGGSVRAGCRSARSMVMGHFKGSKKKKQSFTKGGNTPGGHQAQPPQPLFYPPWVGPWSSFYPPCPFPSAPVPWRGGQGQQPSVSHGQQGVLGRAPKQGNTNAAFLAPGHNFQPTDLPAMFNTMQRQPPGNNWYMDTDATSHLMNGSGSPDGEFVDTVQ